MAAVAAAAAAKIAALKTAAAILAGAKTAPGRFYVTIEGITCFQI
jgi:hypothetical protein